MTQSQHIRMNAIVMVLLLPWIGLQCVIVAFPGITHIFYNVKICDVKVISVSYDNCTKTFVLLYY